MVVNGADKRLFGWCWSLVVCLIALHCDTADAFCPLGCHCDDETLQVSCDDVNLEVIPITLNPSVQRLVLRRNKIRNIDAALRFYTELNYVDFSHNKLVVIQNRSFEAQRKLTELRLDHNKISSVSNATWTGLRNTTVLSLRDNFLQSIDERTFASLPKLRELDLGQNRIEVIHTSAFAGLPDLRSLYLDDNRLSISRPFFPHFLTPLHSLAELSLASNSLEMLGDGAFSMLPELSVLDLSGSSIRNISLAAFQGLAQLRHLLLHDNLLSHVPTASWKYLTHLEHLTLGRNNFSVIRSNAFAPLAKLRRLEIHGAPHLISIEASALETNLDLQALQITNCKKLTSLPDRFLSQHPDLRELILRDNALSFIPEKMAPWSQLTSLDLSGNSLLCSCELKWLRDLLSKAAGVARQKSVPSEAVTQPTSRHRVARHVSVVESHTTLNVGAEVMCSAPLAVANIPVRTLNDDQLGCRGSVTSQALIIGCVCAGLLLLILLLLTAWRYRRNLRLLCSDEKKKKSNCDDGKRKWKAASPTWGVSSNNVSLIGNRNSDYQRACTAEEESFMRAVSLQSSLKPFPRTEL